MKRFRNWWIWAGFGFVLAAALSYIPVFVAFPVTRDFPWFNLLLFAVGFALVGGGLGRALREPTVYRGKVVGSIVGMLSVVLLALFTWGIFFQARQLPTSPDAPRVGQKAPDFTLPDQHGRQVHLADLLKPANSGKPAAVKGVLLIFYRGYW